MIRAQGDIRLYREICTQDDTRLQRAIPVALVVRYAHKATLVSLGAVIPGKCGICKLHTVAELFVEITVRVIRTFKEGFQDEHGDSLIQFCILPVVEQFLKGLYEIMPFGDKSLVFLQVGNLQPSVDPDLRFTGYVTSAVCDKVAKGLSVVLSSERKETAEAGPEIMDLTASVFAEKRTADVLSAHQQVRKDQAVIHVQTDTDIDQLLKGFLQIACQHKDVVRVKVDGIIHAVAAFAAAVAFFTGNSSQIPGCHELVHGTFPFG